MEKFESAKKIEAVVGDLINIANEINRGDYFGQMIADGMAKLHEFFEKINKEDSFDTVMIISSDGEVKLFNTDCNKYGKVCKYIWQCAESWNCLDHICNGDAITFNPLELIEECINDRSFGDVLELYIKDYNGNFIRIME